MLYRDVPAAIVGPAERVDHAHIGMIERGRRARFLLEPCHAAGIRRDIRRPDLDRNRAIQLALLREIHLAHSACAKRSDDLEAAQLSSGGQGQGEGRIIRTNPR